MKIPIHEALARGVAAHKQGKLAEADRLYTAILKKQPTNPDANHNMGVLAVGVGKVEQSLPFFKSAIDANPKIEQFWLSYIDALLKLNDVAAANQIHEQALSRGLDVGDWQSLHQRLVGDYIGIKELQSAVGDLVKLYENGNYDKALMRGEKLSERFPVNSGILNILGAVNVAIKRYDEAIQNYIKAIKVDPSSAEIHNNLGVAYQRKKNSDDAEISYRRAVLLKPDFSEPYVSLSALFFRLNSVDKSRTLISYPRTIDPENKHIRAAFLVTKCTKDSAKILIQCTKMMEKPIWLRTRPVERKLIRAVYNLDNMGANETSDARFGAGRCSVGFSFLDEEIPIIRHLKADIIKLCKAIFQGEVFILDSFFNIFSAHAGSERHNHLGIHDREFSLASRKYSLVYYLDVGDQTSSDPGHLRLYDPDESIKPSQGMIVIIPADRDHGATYDGSKDRILVGVNFYIF